MAPDTQGSNSLPASTGNATPDALTKVLPLLRPKMHRYCTRMIGSALEAEDIVQEALSSAYANWPEGGVRNLEAWLMRIAHNKALDLLRKDKNVHFVELEETHFQKENEPPLEREEVASFALSLFLHLTALQRSSIFLKDVLGYSLDEIAQMQNMTIGAVKAALSRARANLRTLAAQTVDHMPPSLPQEQLALLSKYVTFFQTRDFDALRGLLLNDVELDLRERVQKRGSDNVGRYFGNYAALDDYTVLGGLIENRPALRVEDAEGSFLIILRIERDGIAGITDFRFVRYIAESVEFMPLVFPAG